MMARGSEGASEQGWFSSTHPRHLSGGVRRSHSAVSHERGNRVRAGGRGGVEWGTLSPDHRRRPRCAVVDQVERRARDSRELLELARVRELGDARARARDSARRGGAEREREVVTGSESESESKSESEGRRTCEHGHERERVRVRQRERERERGGGEGSCEAADDRRPTETPVARPRARTSICERPGGSNATQEKRRRRARRTAHARGGVGRRALGARWAGGGFSPVKEMHCGGPGARLGAPFFHGEKLKQLVRERTSFSRLFFECCGHCDVSRNL